MAYYLENKPSMVTHSIALEMICIDMMLGLTARQQLCTIYGDKDDKVKIAHCFDMYFISSKRELYDTLPYIIKVFAIYLKPLDRKFISSMIDE